MLNLWTTIGCLGLVLATGCLPQEETEQEPAEPTAEQTLAAEQTSAAITTMVMVSQSTTVLFGGEPGDEGQVQGDRFRDGHGGPDGGGTDDGLNTMQSNAESAAGGCGTVSLVMGTLRVDYGPPPGCTLPAGHEVSGALTASLSLEPFTVTVGFEQYVIDGNDIDGSAAIILTETTAQVDIDVTRSGLQTDFDLTFAQGATSGVVIDGSLTVDDGTTSTSATLEDVGWESEACYPFSGKASISALLGELEFEATTPQTGDAIWWLPNIFDPDNPIESTFTLPPYGSCPPP